MSLAPLKKPTSSQLQSWLMIIGFYLLLAALITSIVSTWIHGNHYTYVFEVK